MAAKVIYVVVVGDVGRSPRMRYHALSLAKHGWKVRLIGYGGTKLPNDILENEKISVSLMREPPNFSAAFPNIFRYFLKVVLQFFILFWTLLIGGRPSHVLVQNPPSIPAFPAIWFFCLLRGSKFVIDWHNYGHTILALTLGKGHILVRANQWIEKTFGRRADASFCVTKAMKSDLSANFGVRAVVVYDRPPPSFCKLNPEEKHELFITLSHAHGEFSDSGCAEVADPNVTAFTEIDQTGSSFERESRPALLVSSTSWTPDEDFAILLSALQIYDCEKSKATASLPKIVCVITGKGPQREFYRDKIKELSLRHVTILTTWLPAEVYPKILGAADLGVCLHTSSSGLDLPMKVVDMFGCELPVCAVDFSCIDELVQDNENGTIFSDAPGLALQLRQLLQDFPRSGEDLQRLREGAQKFRKVSWDDNWDCNAWPVFQL